MVDRLSVIAAEKLRAEMGKNRMTQKALAKALKVSVLKAANLMAGVHWTCKDLDKAAQLFGCKPTDFIDTEVPA